MEAAAPPLCKEALIKGQGCTALSRVPDTKRCTSFKIKEETIYAGCTAPACPKSGRANSVQIRCASKGRGRECGSRTLGSSESAVSCGKSHRVINIRTRRVLGGGEPRGTALMGGGRRAAAGPRLGGLRLPLWEAPQLSRHEPGPSLGCWDLTPGLLLSRHVIFNLSFLIWSMGIIVIWINKLTYLKC